MLPLVPFLDFLKRHVLYVAIDFVLLVYNNKTKPEANAISTTLNALPTAVIALNLHTQLLKPPNLFRFKRILVISLVVQQSGNFMAALHMIQFSQGHRFVFVLNASASDEVTLHQQIMRNQNAFYAILQDDGRRAAFVVWHFMGDDVAGKRSADLVRLPDERAFVNSVHWQVFRAQLDRIPGAIDEQLTSVTLIYCPMNACPLIYRNTTQFMAGLWPGLSHLVAHAVGARRQTNSFFTLDKNETDLKPLAVRFIDRRQFTERANRSTNYRWTNRVYRPDFWVNSMQVRYVVLAPRQLIGFTKTQLLNRAWDVGVFVAIAIGFTMLRFEFRTVLARPPKPDFAQLFFNTLPKTFGIASGQSIGSAADRVLLSVIAVFAILLGSLFSGLMYGQMILVGHRERYSTLLDLCEDRVPINIPPELLQKDLLTDVSPLCVIRGQKQGKLIELNEAYVLEEDMAIDMRSDFHILPELFGTFPVPLVTSHWFLRRPIQMALGRCSDHGLYQGLLAAANHSATLWTGSYKAKEQLIPGTNAGSVLNRFEFIWLVIGWVCAIFTFGCELLVVWWTKGCRGNRWRKRV